MKTLADVWQGRVVTNRFRIELRSFNNIWIENKRPLTGLLLVKFINNLTGVLPSCSKRILTSRLVAIYLTYLIITNTFQPTVVPRLVRFIVRQVAEIVDLPTYLGHRMFLQCLVLTRLLSGYKITDIMRDEQHFISTWCYML